MTHCEAEAHRVCTPIKMHKCGQKPPQPSLRAEAPESREGSTMRDGSLLVTAARETPQATQDQKGAKAHVA